MGNTAGKPHRRPRNKKQVRWKAADRPLPPGKPQLLPDPYSSSPDVITIRWTPPKSDGGSPITGYLVEHRRCGSTHWVRATPLLVPFPEVSLSGLEPGWRYQFRISAENAVGMSMPSEISEPLTVTLQRSSITAPQFTEELKDTVALENEKIEFVVHFLGQPAPKICWFKDGFEIFSSRRTRIMTENDRSMLTIHQAALSDEGEIKCTATNRAGHASTRAILKLEAPPTIRLPRQYEDGLLFEIGEVIRLKVSIAGRPAPLVFWTHNGESLKSDDRYEIESTDRFSTLKINEARRTDRGEYQVKAVNKLGEDVSSFLVTVTDKPSPPGKAKVVMTLGRSVTLSWKSPEDDGGCKIGNYIVEYYRVGWDVWLKAASCRQLTTVLGDLIEGSEYKFRIKAESPYGISDPSEESETIFIPDPKRGIMGPYQRAKSQPPDLLPSDYISIQYEPKTEIKPRSRSSSRTEKHVTISEITDVIPPVRPRRTKSKSAPQTPLPSPAVTRRTANFNPIDKGMFDRSSLARELAYGSPGLKTRRLEETESTFNTNTTTAKSRNEGHGDGVSNNNNKKITQSVGTQECGRYTNERPMTPSSKSSYQRAKSPSISNSRRPNSPVVENSIQSPVSPLAATNQRPTSPSVQNNHQNNTIISSFVENSFQRPKSPPILSNQKPSSPFTGDHNRRTISILNENGGTLEREVNYYDEDTTSVPYSNKLDINKHSHDAYSVGNGESSPSHKQTFSKSVNSLEHQNIQRPLSPSLEESDTNLRSPSSQTRTEQNKSSSYETYLNQSQLKSPPPTRKMKGGLLVATGNSRSPSPNERKKPSDTEYDKNFNINRRENSKSPSLEYFLDKKSPSPERLSPNTVDFPTSPRNRHDSVTGSSEFMLVLLPDEKAGGHGSSPDIRFNFDEISVPPPLSLSAPELGVEPPQFDIIRSASSTDILREKQMQRVYEAVAAEEDELRKRRKEQQDIKSEPKLDIPKIQINSKDAEPAPFEKIPSFRRRLSGGSLPHHLLTQRRNSLRNSDLGEIPENRIHKFEFSIEEKREIFKTRQRSRSEEMEEMEFEKVRQKTEGQGKEVKREIAVADERSWEEESSEESCSESVSSEDERHQEDLLPPLDVEEEEPMYRPGLMISRNNTKGNEPFEILTKRCALPDPNFVPKPILKKREEDFSHIPDKPTRKDLEQKQRGRSHSLFPKLNSLDHRQRSSSPRPPQVTNFEKRGSLPAVNLETFPAIPESFLERNPSPEQPKQRVRSNEEIKAVADHYGDLLKSYGYTKRNAPQLYLDRDELKAAAEEQSNENLQEIERSMDSLVVLENKGTEIYNSNARVDRISRSRTTSMNSENGEQDFSFEIASGRQTTSSNLEEGEAFSKRRGSNSSQVSANNRRRGSVTEQKKSSKSSQKTNSRVKSRTPSKSPARQENWSYLRAAPSPQSGRKASPSPQRRNSLNNSPVAVSSRRKMLREITTQTSGFDDNYLPYPRVPTPEQEELVARAEVKVRSTIDYLTDVAMLIVACWLYLFYHELLAVPVLLILVYRQLKEEISKRLPKWMLPKRKRKQKK